jgi:hypothetical protein
MRLLKSPVSLLRNGAFSCLEEIEGLKLLRAESLAPPKAILQLTKPIFRPFLGIILNVISNPPKGLFVSNDMIMESRLPNEVNFIHGCIFFHPNLKSSNY